MAYEQAGRIVKILEKQSGTSKAGKEWVKQSFVIDKGTEYNSEICFNLFGEYKVKLLDKYEVGSQVEVSFNVTSREYNGQYYTSADAFRVADHIPLNPMDKDGNFIEKLDEFDKAFGVEKNDSPF